MAWLMHRCFKWCREDTVRCSDKTSLMKHLCSSLLFIMLYTSAAFSFALPRGRKVALIRVYCKYADFWRCLVIFVWADRHARLLKSCLSRSQPAAPPSCFYSCRCLLQGFPSHVLFSPVQMFVLQDSAGGNHSSVARMCEKILESRKGSVKQCSAGLRVRKWGVLVSEKWKK